jgi:hypothetical protein
VHELVRRLLDQVPLDRAEGEEAMPRQREQDRNQPSPPTTQNRNRQSKGAR